MGVRNTPKHTNRDNGIDKGRDKAETETERQKDRKTERPKSVPTALPRKRCLFSTEKAVDSAYEKSEGLPLGLVSLSVSVAGEAVVLVLVLVLVFAPLVGWGATSHSMFLISFSNTSTGSQMCERMQLLSCAGFMSMSDECICCLAYRAKNESTPERAMSMWLKVLFLARALVDRAAALLAFTGSLEFEEAVVLAEAELGPSEEASIRILWRRPMDSWSSRMNTKVPLAI